MKCDCKNYNECISCVYYDDCDDKPCNPNAKWTLIFIGVIIATILIIII